jgi:hypothetical protein
MPSGDPFRLARCWLRPPISSYAMFGLRRIEMLQTIAIVLVVLWLLGMVSAYTMGGLIHVLLVIAVVVVLLRVIQGRRL